MGNARFYVGDALLRIAHFIAGVGNAFLGNPFVKVAVAVEAGSRELVLDPAPPKAITRGLRLIGTDADEMARVVAIRGHHVTIDRPLARAYAVGSAAKLLI